MATIRLRMNEHLRAKLDAYGVFSKAVMRGPSGLTLIQRQMIATLTSALNGCKY